MYIYIYIEFVMSYMCCFSKRTRENGGSPDLFGFAALSQNGEAPWTVFTLLSL